MTTYNDEICYVKHVSVPFYLGVGGGRGLPWGLGNNLVMQFSRLGSPKMEIFSKLILLTIQNDQISYVKHVLAPLYVVFTLFGRGGGGGGPMGSRAQPTDAVFPHQQLKNGKFFETDFFDYPK